jgi:hypothetical protein
MRQVATSEPAAGEVAAWKVRTGDWYDEAERVLREVAPTRVAAFKADLLFVDALGGEAPNWIANDLLDLELRIESLRQIRATL